MVRITLNRNLGHPHQLVVLGHAGAGAYGEDVVCAAVSALVETLRLALERFRCRDWTARIDEGSARFCFGPGLDTNGVTIVDAIVMGLEDLSVSHSAFVQFQENRNTTPQGMG